MNLQKKVTESYLKLNNYPTLKFISQDTGVQLTRTFRLLNGASMKLSEYEIFKNKVQEKIGTKSLFLEENWMELSPSELSEINYLLQKKLKIKKIKEDL